MAGLRRLDAFVKPREDLRTRSALGGFITLVAAAAASVLFLAQVTMYLVGATRHSLHLSDSKSMPIPLLDGVVKGSSSSYSHSKMLEATAGGGGGTIPLRAHLTFPHLQCPQMDVALDGASFRSGELNKVLVGAGKVAVEFRHPSSSEIIAALGKDHAQDHKGGCTVYCKLDIPVVGGTFSATVTPKAWSESRTQLMFGPFGQVRFTPGTFNVSHYVHSITFGKQFPLTTNPLEKAAHTIENASGGLGVAHVDVRLVPTRYQRFLSHQDTYQASVIENIVQPETLAAQGSAHLPGLSLTYDFTPLAVHHVETRENIFVFISSLVSIVGGVFVTVGLVTGCLVHSAAAVAKKMD